MQVLEVVQEPYATIIFAVFACASLLLVMFGNTKRSAVLSCVILTVGMIITALWPNPGTKYKVTFADEAQKQQILEQYEVVDVDGLVYTIREKE